MDNAVDTFRLPVPAVQSMAMKTRRCGVGIMGLGDMLFNLGIPYDTSEGRKMSADVLRTIQEACVETTKELAIEKGAFEHWDKSVYSKIPGEPLRRNAYVSSVAPTGPH